ncbi:MAG: AglZ/HisF2 family acetamidino modification protein [Fibrobacteria bacterium]
MLQPRIIPCLLVKNNGLVKTRQFKDPKYVGDPINAVKIFNEKEVDEIMVLDIDASAQDREPDYRMIENLAAECRMPLCYGGGIKKADQARRIFGLGVEKVAVSSVAVERPEIIAEMASQVGRQSVVVVLDVKSRKPGGPWEIWSHNGQRNTRKDPVSFARDMETLGAGEIVINSIERDGMLEGYDLPLVDAVREAVGVPMTILGGAGSAKDIGDLIARQGIIGAAAGSLFVFKGKYRAVLVNYPNPQEKNDLVNQSLKYFSASRKDGPA